MPVTEDKKGEQYNRKRVRDFVYLPFPHIFSSLAQGLRIYSVLIPISLILHCACCTNLCSVRCAVAKSMTSLLEEIGFRILLPRCTCSRPSYYSSLRQKHPVPLGIAVKLGDIEYLSDIKWTVLALLTELKSGENPSVIAMFARSSPC